MMVLRSPAFADKETIPAKYAKSGENVSPPLSWEGPPKGTKSLALAIVDRHPVARNYVHWLVSDIDPGVSSLAEGASGGQMPDGSRELKPYTGPNPPSGSHDYEFILYALKTEKLDLPKKVNLDLFTEAVEQNSLGSVSLVGVYTKIRK
jgi:Raf kinase inhibitor-like YbhB/YbcL family protein